MPGVQGVPASQLWTEPQQQQRSNSCASNRRGTELLQDAEGASPGASTGERWGALVRGLQSGDQAIPCK